MENRILKSGSVEMAVVCSDLSLLENINSLLRQNGVISVEDEYGVLHYIVDGRENRKEVAGKVTSLSCPSKTERLDRARDDAFLELCIKSVLREYGFDMALIGTNILYDSIFNTLKEGSFLPSTMKGLYTDSGMVHGLSYQQSERDVRYAIVRSSLKNMRSRAAVRCILSRIERRLGFRDPLY